MLGKFIDMISDLVLINNKDSKKNLLGQKAATRDFCTPDTTHVALMVGTYKAIHAMPAPEHVGLTLTHDLLSPDVEWNVWRHQTLSERINSSPNEQAEFIWHAEWHIGERYNKRVIRRQRQQHHSFCSELIGKVYSKFGIDFSSEPEKLLPIQITKYILDHRETWGEVTREYQAIRSEPLYQRLHDKKNSEVAKKTKDDFLSAQAEANERNALVVEAIERLDRFNDWTVEKGSNGWEVWTKSLSPKSSRLSYEASEWLSFFERDKYDEHFLEIFGSAHDYHI